MLTTFENTGAVLTADDLRPRAGDTAEALLAKFLASQNLATAPVEISADATAATGRYYIAKAPLTLTIPDTARPGWLCHIESGVEASVILGTPGAGWTFLYPGGRYRTACAVQGMGGVIRAEVVRPGVVAVTGSGVPYNNGWLPTQAGANCLLVCRAGSHHLWQDYGGSNGGGGADTYQALSAGAVMRWGGLFGNGGAMVFDPAAGDEASFAPKAEADPSFLSVGEAVRFRESAGPARELISTVIPPAAGAFSFYLALRNRGTLPASLAPAMVATMGGTNANAAAFGWGGMKQGLCFAGGTYGWQWQTSVNTPAAYGTKPASADFSTNENTLLPRLVSVEVTAGGVGDVYVGETKVTAGGVASGAFTATEFRLNPHLYLNVSAVGLFADIPSSAADRLARQRYFAGFAL